MVENNRWRSLVEFSNCLSFPIVQWLKQEQFNLGADLKTLFKDLHSQFGLSLPTEISVVWCGIKMASTGHRRNSDIIVSPVAANMNFRRRESESYLTARISGRDNASRRLSSKSSVSLTSPEAMSLEQQLWAKANMHEVELFFKMHRDSLVLIRYLAQFLITIFLLGSCLPLSKKRDKGTTIWV